MTSGEFVARDGGVPTLVGLQKEGAIKLFSEGILQITLDQVLVDRDKIYTATEAREMAETVFHETLRKVLGWHCEEIFVGVVEEGQAEATGSVYIYDRPQAIEIKLPDPGEQ